MTTAKQVLSLIDSHYTRDESRFKATVSQIAAHSKSPSLNVRLEKYLNRGGTLELVDLKQLNWKSAKYWQQVETFDRSQIVLPPEVERRFDWVLEQHRQDRVLRESGLQAPQRLLFHGPPGVGKSMAARVLANVLGLPAILLRVDAVVGSYLGQTASAIREALEVPEQVPAVYVLDEIDSIGTTRASEPGGGGASQELARTLNTFLSVLDASDFRGPLVATTNRVDLLDPALLRRWRPLKFWTSKPELRRLAAQHGVDWDHVTSSTGLSDTDGAAVPGLSPAEVVAICEEAARIKHLLGGSMGIDEAAKRAVEELDLV